MGTNWNKKLYSHEVDNFLLSWDKKKFIFQKNSPIVEVIGTYSTSNKSPLKKTLGPLGVITKRKVVAYRGNRLTIGICI